MGLIDRFSIDFRTAPTADEVVVLVPVGGDLAEGFRRAKALIDQGSAARLIGLGVTVPPVRPAWAKTGVPLVLSELWAYQARSPMEATTALRAGIDAWLDRIFDSPVEDFRGHDVFYGAACTRIFQKALVAQPAVQAIAQHHGTQTIHVVGKWIGLEALRRSVAARGGKVHADVASPTTNRGWGLRMAGLGAAALGATVVDQSRAFLRSRRTRSALGALRERADAPTPDTWIVLIADWLRFSRIVIHSVALPELASGRKLGILLAASLVPGARDEVDMRRHVGTELWTGIGELAKRLDDCAIDQVVGPETAFELVRTLARSTVASVRAIRRVGAAGSTIGDAESYVNLEPYAVEVAKLVTLDLARANLAAAATRAVLGRHSFSGETVVLAASSNEALTTTDLLFQSAGATTIELSHGSIGTGEPGTRETKAQKLCVWSHADARVLAPLECIVAGTPTHVATRATPPRDVRNVLYVSNYVHQAYLESGRFPLEPLQSELMRSAAFVRRVVGPDATIRWRPHPADDERAIARSLALAPDVERSRGRTLHEDVAWADVIICTPSSSLFEVILAGVPVFLHLTPDYAETPAGDFMAAERTFFYAEEIEAKLATCVAALRQSKDGALAPEHEARERLFGSGGRPRPFSELLSRRVDESGRGA